MLPFFTKLKYKLFCEVNNKTILSLFTVQTVLFVLLQPWCSLFKLNVPLTSQFWRLYTAHWVHINTTHLVYNAIALWCLPAIFSWQCLKKLPLLLLLLPPCISACILILNPHIGSYCGFSGVLHGLYVYAALASITIPKERNWGVVILVLIVIKIILEQCQLFSFGGNTMSFFILVDAHAYGAAAALVFFVLHGVLCVKKQPVAHKIN